MLSAYPACFLKEENGYSVIFPDLNYLATCGDTFDDALAMAVDVLAGYLFTAKLEGGDIPAPSDVMAVDSAAVAHELEVEPVESLVNIVAVDVDEYARTHFTKSVKKTLSVPTWLNEMATAKGINFSQVLQEGLKARLGL